MTTAKEQNASGKQAQQQDQVNAYFPQFQTDTDLQCVALCFSYDCYDFLKNLFGVCT